MTKAGTMRRKEKREKPQRDPLPGRTDVQEMLCVQRRQMDKESSFRKKRQSGIKHVTPEMIQII